MSIKISIFFLYIQRLILHSSSIFRCIQMSLVHDLAECVVGDLAPADNVSKDDKKCREKVR